MISETDKRLVQAYTKLVGHAPAIGFIDVVHLLGREPLRSIVLEIWEGEE